MNNLLKRLMRVAQASACATLVFVSASVCYADSSFRVVAKDTTLSLLIEYLDANENKLDFYKLFCLEFGKALQSKYSDLKNLPIVLEIQHKSKVETVRLSELMVRSKSETIKELVVSLNYDELFYSDLKSLGEISVRVDEKNSNLETLTSSSIRLLNTLPEIKRSIQAANDCFVLLSGRTSILHIKEYRSFETSEVSRVTYKIEILRE